MALDVPNRLNVCPKGCDMACVIACVPNNDMWIVVESCVDPPNGIETFIYGILEPLEVDVSCPWLCLVPLFGIGFA